MQNLAGRSSKDVTTCSKIYINHWQGSTNINLGRGILRIWQGELKLGRAVLKGCFKMLQDTVMLQEVFLS